MMLSTREKIALIAASKRVSSAKGEKGQESSSPQNEREKKK